MFSMMKADFWRIFRGKGIWITLVILLLSNLLMAGSFLSDGVDFELEFGVEIGFEEMEYDDDYVDVGAGLPFYGGNIPTYVTSEIILIFILPIINFISIADFSSGAVGNAIATGINRKSHYLSKMILSCLIVAIMFISFIFIPTVIVTIFNGFGGGFAKGTLVMFLGRFLLTMAATSFAIMLSFVTKKAEKVMGIYFLVLFAPNMILHILGQIYGVFRNWVDYEFISSFVQLDVQYYLSTTDTVRIFVMGAVVLVLSVVIGLWSFRKAEIR